VAVWTLFAAGATNAVIAQEQSDVVRGTPYSAIPALNRTSLPGERDHGPVRRPGDAATTELLPTWAGPPPVESLPTWSGPSPVTLTRQERGSPTLTAFATDTVRPSDGTTNHSPVVGEAGTQAAAVDGRLNASNPQSWPHFHRVEKAVFESPAPDGVAPTEQSAGTGVSAESASPLSLELASPQGLSQTLRLGLLVGVMSLAPAILLMTTCYVRVIVVLGLLRQAIGAQQFPPTQVLTALSLFLTALVMWPVWERCYREGIQPYTESASKSQTADFQTAFTRTAAPVRSFMSQQIEATGNTAAIDLLMEYQAAGTTASTVQPEYYEEVPLQALLPAYVLSELKTAFLIGFQIYLPFVVIDLVVSSVLASLGLGMLSPAVVSLPFKLLLFVLIDGWFLTVELLLQGIPPLT